MIRVFLSVVLLASAWFSQAAPAQQPNIVIIYTDDLGYGDLGSYGHPYIKTPNLDQMAEEGQRWTDFYVPAPVCSPSRGALLTGMQPVRSGLYGTETAVMFPGDPNGIPQEFTTLAEGLKGAGYATGMFGKWHLGDAPENYPTRNGFDYWYGMPYSNDMNFNARMTPEQVWIAKREGQLTELMAGFHNLLDSFKHPVSADYKVPLINSDCRQGDCEDAILETAVEQTTITRRLTEKAIEFMTENKDGPFFVYLPYSMPHLPVFASQDFEGSSLTGVYGDTIQEIDWAAGQIRDALKELGIAENTLVVFSSDNGPWQHAGGMKIAARVAGSAGPLRDAKTTTYEGGVRVPGIFWWPGKIKPQTTTDIGSVLDLYVTAMTLAGADLPEVTDGFDLTPVLLSGAASPRTELGFYRHGKLRAYRYGDYKVQLFASMQAKEPLAVPELYNLRQDISEHDNIAAENPELLKEIMAAVERHTAAMPKAEPIFEKRFEELAIKYREK